MSDGADNDLQNQLDAFNEEVHAAIREIAARHFDGWFLRAHVLSMGLYDPVEERERIHVLSPDGQSAFTTLGIISHSHNSLLQ